MNQKLPYYMAYPMPLAYDDERVERMDLEYMNAKKEKEQNEEVRA